MASLKRKIDQRKSLYARNKLFTYLTGIFTLIFFIVGALMFYNAPPPGMGEYIDEFGRMMTYEKFSLLKTLGGIIIAGALLLFIFFTTFLVSMLMVKPISKKIVCNYCGAIYDPETPLTRCMDCMKPFKL